MFVVPLDRRACEDGVGIFLTSFRLANRKEVNKEEEEFGKISVVLTRIAAFRDEAKAAAAYKEEKSSTKSLPTAW